MRKSAKITTHDQLQSALPIRKRTSPVGPSLLILFLLFCVAGALWLNLQHKAEHGNEAAEPPATTHKAAPGMVPRERQPTVQIKVATALSTPDSATEDIARPQKVRAEPLEVSEESTNPSKAPVAAIYPTLAPVRALKPIAVCLAQTESSLTMELGLPPGKQTLSLQDASVRKHAIAVLFSRADGTMVPLGDAAITSWTSPSGGEVVDVVLSFEGMPALSQLVQLMNARLYGRSELILSWESGKEELSFPFSINPNQVSVPLLKKP